MLEQALSLNDPYQELGLEATASDADIRKAYFALVRVHSPEKDPLRFKQIRAAYERLSEPQKRLETDMLRLQAWSVIELTSSKGPVSSWASDVLMAARSLSDLDRRHFREDFREVKF